MEILPSDASDAEVLAAVRRWVDLIADGNPEAAVAFLWQGDGANRTAASAAGLLAWIGRYEPAPPLTRAAARVTSPHTAAGPMESLQEVFRRDDGTVSSVDFAMPINGEWSELVAFFDLVAVDGGQALSLRDMYVA